MSISTHAELLTALENYLHRSDLTSILPDFISLAEAKLNRRLRLRAQETTATGSVASSVGLPADFVELISIKVTTGGTTYPIDYKPTGKTRGESGGTYYYTTVGSNIEFESVASGATYKLTYYAKFAALSAGVNWLITNAPDVYLYASLLEAEPYLKDDERITLWSNLLENSISGLETADRNSKFGNNLRMRAG